MPPRMTEYEQHVFWYAAPSYLVDELCCCVARAPAYLMDAAFVVMADGTCAVCMEYHY